MEPVRVKSSSAMHLSHEVFFFFGVRVLPKDCGIEDDGGGGGEERTADIFFPRRLFLPLTKRRYVSVLCENVAFIQIDISLKSTITIGFHLGKERTRNGKEQWQDYPISATHLVDTVAVD